MWCLDPVNSPDLIARLRPFGRDRDFEVAWVGEGWRSLVDECHTRIVAVLPDYELVNIKESWGVLIYQACPLRVVDGERLWSADEHRVLGTITSDIQTRSEKVCEWCGAAGRLREWRKLELTLCDACDHRFPDPPYPVHTLRELLCRRTPANRRAGRNLGRVAHQAKPIRRISSEARHALVISLGGRWL